MEKIKNSTAVKIYMTATYEAIMSIFDINEVEILYKQYGIEERTSNKQKNIRTIFRTNNNSIFFSKVSKNTNKSLILFSKISDAYKYHEELEDSIFNCSKSNTQYYKYVNKAEIKYLIEESSFKGKFLCSTTVLESGVNIIDNRLDLIAYHGYFTKDTVEQIAGRKRFEYIEDVLDFIVYEPNSYVIASKIRMLEHELSEIDYARQEGICKILEKRKNKFENKSWLRLEDNASLTIDYTKEQQIKSELEWLYEIKDIGISGYLAKIHGVDEVINLDNEVLCNNIKGILNKKIIESYTSNLKDILEENDIVIKKDFIKLLKEYGIRSSNGSKENSIGLKLINKFFKDKKLDYTVVSKYLYYTIDNKRLKLTYWKVIEI